LVCKLSLLPLLVEAEKVSRAAPSSRSAEPSVAQVFCSVLADLPYEPLAGGGDEDLMGLGLAGDIACNRRLSLMRIRRAFP